MSEAQVSCPFCNQRHQVKRQPPEKEENKGDAVEAVPVGKILGGVVAAAGVAGLAAPVLANAGLQLAGFTGKGIKKGTVAASMHSGTGRVKKDSGFANVQSFGAKGGFSQFGFLALGAAVAAGATALGYGAYQHVAEREEQIRVQYNICEECWKVHRREFTGGMEFK